jgi:NAD+-dependent secondary alcohol dehydrogenase Adh1
LKAARLVQYNQPLRVEDVPEPAVAEPTDVIVKIGGAGVCHTDLHLIEGVWKDTLGVSLPYTLGHENAGWVYEVGAGVSSVRVGDPVIVHPVASCGRCLACRSGEDMHCEHLQFPGLTVDGGFAHYLKTNERALVPLPPGVDPSDVAPYADAGVTAYRAVRKIAPVARPGTFGVLVGVGGLGHIAVQLLREMGSSVIIAVDQSGERLDLALELGADHAVRAGDRAVSEVRDVTAGRGADFVIDFVGSDETHRQGIEMLRKGGAYVVVGYGGTVRVPSLSIINNEFAIVGSLVGNYRDLWELMQLHRRGRVRLRTQKFALGEINEVLDRLHAGRVTGRAVVVPE